MTINDVTTVKSAMRCVAISISRKICVNEIGDKVLTFMFSGKTKLSICACYHASLKKLFGNVGLFFYTLK